MKQSQGQQEFTRREREVYGMFETQRMNVHQIAAQLGLSRITVWRHYATARTKAYNAKLAQSGRGSLDKTFDEAVAS